MAQEGSKRMRRVKWMGNCDRELKWQGVIRCVTQSTGIMKEEAERFAREVRLL